MDPAPTDLPACKRCGTTAPADDNGQCSNPKCRALRSGHQRTRKYALDEQDVRVKTAKYVRDYGAVTEDERDLCREYAEAVLSLRQIRKGTQERVRVLAERKDLRADLEAMRAKRTASSMSHEPRVLFYLPAKGELEVRAAMEREARTPGAAGPSREVIPTEQLAAPAAGSDDLLDLHRVPERIITRDGALTRIERRTRRVTESEISQMLEASGDLENYKTGRLSREDAIRQTANWVRSKWNANEL